MGKPDGKRPLGRPTRRWEDNIKMDIQEVGWEAWTGFMRLWTGRQVVGVLLYRGADKSLARPD